MQKELKLKKHSAKRRNHRVRSRLYGRPRLSIYISNTNVTAQIIDDDQGKTLAYATTVGDKSTSGSLTEKAAAVGKQIALKAKKVKVRKVSLDRGSRHYHGRVKALADAAREQGLEF